MIKIENTKTNSSQVLLFHRMSLAIVCEDSHLHIITISDIGNDNALKPCKTYMALRDAIKS